MSDKESKKLPKPPQRHISLGLIPFNVAVGLVGFRAEPATDTKNKKNTTALQIVYQEKNEDQGLAVTEVSTPNAVVDGAEQGNGPTKEDTGDTGEGGDELAEASISKSWKV